jgi:hypothetical protein
VALLVLGLVLLAASVILPSESWIARELSRLAGLALTVIAAFRLIARRR